MDDTARTGVGPRYQLGSVVGSTFAAAVRESDGSTTFAVAIGAVENATAIEAAIGIRVFGFVRVLDSGNVRHALREHGQADREAGRPRRQDPLDDTDFDLIPAIVHSGQIVQTRPHKQRPTVTYEAILGAYCFTYVEEVRRSAQQIAFKTMWKAKR